VLSVFLPGIIEVGINRCALLKGIVPAIKPHTHDVKPSLGKGLEVRSNALVVKVGRLKPLKLAVEVRAPPGTGKLGREGRGIFMSDRNLLPKNL